MFFWKINLLKERLIHQGLSQKHLFIYIFIYVVLSEVLLEAAFYLPDQGMNVYDYTQTIINILVICLGTFLIYRANGGSNGAQFAERYFSIGFVITVRFIALLILIAIALSFVWYNETPESESTTTWYEFVVISMWIIGLYWRIIVHVKDVSIKSTA